MAEILQGVGKGEADSTSTLRSSTSPWQTSCVDTTTAATGSTNATTAAFNAIPNVDDTDAVSDVEYSEAGNCGYYVKKFIGGTEFTDDTGYPDYLCYVEATEFAGYNEYLGYTGSTDGAEFSYVHVALAEDT